MDLNKHDFKHPLKIESGSRKRSLETLVKIESGSCKHSLETPVKIESGSRKRSLETLVKIESGSCKRSQGTPVNAANFEFPRIPKNETKQQCDFFEPDNFDADANTITFEVSFAFARSSLDEKQIACYFASALCAYQGGLMTAVKNALEEHDITLNVIKLPSGAKSVGINLNVCPYRFDESEVHMFVGTWLILLFKNLSHANYYNFISKRVCALGGKLGLAKKRIEAFKFLIQFNQAKAIRDVLGTSKVLKHKVRDFVRWLSGNNCARGCSMGRYVWMFCIPPDPPSMDYNQALVFLRSLSEPSFN